MEAILGVKTLDFKGSIYTSSALCVCVNSARKLCPEMLAKQPRWTQWWWWKVPWVYMVTLEVSLVPYSVSDHAYWHMPPNSARMRQLCHLPALGCNSSSSSWWPKGCPNKMWGVCTSKSMNLPKCWTQISTHRTHPRQSIGSVHKVPPFDGAEHAAWQDFMISSSSYFVRQWIIFLSLASRC